LNKSIEPDRVPVTYDTGAGDRDFRKARKYAGRRDMFFYEMHAALRYVLHETRRDFLVFITAEEDLE
jgi:hypothetical protein